MNSGRGGGAGLENLFRGSFIIIINGCLVVAWFQYHLLDYLVLWLLFILACSLVIIDSCLFSNCEVLSTCFIHIPYSSEVISYIRRSSNIIHGAVQSVLMACLVVIRSGVLAHAWCDPVVWCRYSGYNLVYLLVLRSLHRASGSGIYSGCEGSAVTYIRKSACVYVEYNRDKKFKHVVTARVVCTTRNRCDNHIVMQLLYVKVLCPGAIQIIFQWRRGNNPYISTFHGHWSEYCHPTV